MAENDLDTTRERILEAAGQMFAERGFEATTVRDICQAAGANVAAVNYYFGDKERLYIEAVVRAHRWRLDQAALPDWDANTPPRKKLADFIHTFFRRVLGGPDDTWRTRLVMREIMQPSAACAEIAQSNIRPQFEILQGILRELLPQCQRRRAASDGVQHCRPVLVLSRCRSDHSQSCRPAKSTRRYDIDKLAEHVTRFTLGAIDARSREPSRRGSRAMNWIALKMLTGNQGKYLGIILGIAFATLLIAQQASIFCGLMLQTSGQIRDIQGADIWVMDPNVQFSDDVKPLSDSDLYRVRGVPGVAWAVPLYKGLTRSRLEDGNFQQTILLGLDDATLVGAPPNMILGSMFDLRKPDAVIMDLEGYKLLWPHEEPRIGKRFEMNDKEAEIVGICKASRTFQTFPVVYTRYSQALEFVPPERKVLSFVLADAAQGRERRRSLPADRKADRPAGGHRAAVRMDHDGVLHAEDRHPVQLRHHGGARVSSSARRSPRRRFTCSRSRTSSNTARSRRWARAIWR